MVEPEAAVKITSDKDSDAADVVDEAIEASCPHLYCNGFINVISNADILTILQQNGKTIGTLNLSFTVAKTLGASLGQAIGDLERSTGREIMTVSDVLKNNKDEAEEAK